MPESAALLALIREHCSRTHRWGRVCRVCDPPSGRYCAVAGPLMKRFAELRRAEVRAGGAGG